MKVHHSTGILAAICVCVLDASYAAAEEQSRSVSASVRHGGSGVGINAERVPGQFTVPEGHIGSGLKYHFNDPSTGYTSTRLTGSNIYSETQGRYMSEVEGNPGAQLPPGKYKFVVGGRPGASGSLSFKIISTTTEPPDDHPPSNELRLPMNFDVTYNLLNDVYYTHEGSRKRVGEYGLGEWGHPDRVTVRFRDGKVNSEYTLRYPTVEGLKGTDTHTMVGTLSNGRFSGTVKVDSHYEVTLNSGQVLHRNYGIVYSLTGQVDASGTLVIHGRWQSDYGQEETLALNERGRTISIGNGKVQITTKKYESHASVKSGTWELHLRLPVGQSSALHKSTRTKPPAAQPPTKPQPPTPGGEVATTPGNTVWDIPNNDSPWEPPATPPVIKKERTDPNNIWNTDDRPEVDDLADDGDDEDGPKIGDRLPDGKILFKPPWDIGDPYPMDSEEVADIQRRQADGYRWSDRHGWVNDEDKKRLDDIAEIEHRGDEKEK